MRYETAKNLKDGDFKRSTGVERRTFEKMLGAVEKGQCDFGRPTRLSRADQLLLTLMYWREYHTQFHIGLTYGVSEATVCRTIRKIEKALAQSRQFRLPGKKVLHANGTAIEILVVDATEQPIERPKKAKVGITVAKRNGTLKKRR